MKNLEKRGERWFFRMVVNGRKVREDVGDNPVEARRRAKLLRQRHRDRRRRGRRSLVATVEDFAQRWSEEYLPQQRNESGRDLAARRLDKYTLPELGRLFLEDVRPEHIRGLRARIEAAEVSPQTVKHVLSDVRCMFRYAVDVGALAASPFRGRLMPKIQEAAPRALTEAQVAEVLRVAGRYEFPIRLALLTGLRWGELHRLTWHHVHELPERHLLIERTKSGKVRRVPLGTEAWELLKAARETTSSVHVYGPRHQASAQIVRHVRKGVTWPFTFHALRHTFGRRWVESGASLATLQEILGHGSIQVTQRYSRLTESAVFSEAKRVLG